MVLAGLGDGPDADPDAMMDMDLTIRQARRAQSGRRRLLQGDGTAASKPKMPAFKEELTDGPGLGGRRLRAVAPETNDVPVGRLRARSSASDAQFSCTRALYRISLESRR